jgi:RecJ-like exonuclease
MRKIIGRRIEKHFDSEKERVRVARLSKNPQIAKLETDMQTVAERVKKEGIQ